MKNNLIIVFKILFWLFFLNLFFPFLKKPSQKSFDSFNSPNENIIVQEIKSRNGIVQNGSFFAGRTESFLGIGDPAMSGRNWMQFHRFQALCNDAVGNDLKTLGLWKFDIPTLFHYSPLRDPFLYYFSTQLLSEKNDEQNKNISVLTKPDPKILGLLGVRFIITDNEMDHSDLKYITKILFPKDKSNLKNIWWGSTNINPWQNIKGFYLYEIKNPNLGTKTPRIISQKNNNPQDILHKLKYEIENDGSLPIAIIDQTLQQPIHPAENAAITYTSKGFKIKAKANKLSALLIPVTYSSCLNFKNTDKKSNNKTYLIRANLCQTLIVFDNSIDGELLYLSSPFVNPQSIWNDVKEAIQLFSNYK